jgi:hypothetical protein
MTQIGPGQLCRRDAPPECLSHGLLLMFSRASAVGAAPFDAPSGIGPVLGGSTYER